MVHMLINVIVAKRSLRSRTRLADPLLESSIECLNRQLPHHIESWLGLHIVSMKAGGSACLEVWMRLHAVDLAVVVFCSIKAVQNMVIAPYFVALDVQAQRCWVLEQ